MEKEIHNKLKWYEIPIAVVVIIVSAHVWGKGYGDRKTMSHDNRWGIGKK